MPDEGDKPERLKAPPQDDQRTTPHGTRTHSAETSELHMGEPSLRALGQRYDLLAEIGRGGMGIVYRARDHETGDIVALKVLKPEIAGQPDLIERFKSELLLARKITHKNVCRIYDLHRFGETAAIAMEYVEGESLRHLLARFNPISVRKGLEWTHQICGALGEAHAQGVVHRDLKPENLVIDRDGNVKVMDFGIARSIETTTTTTGAIVGTPAYMAPEQAAGKTVDSRSDIYSLGLILYEMFTGRHAFKADTPVAFALKQIHETPRPARDVEPYLPGFIDGVIQKCLEKDPKNRFQNMAELEAELSEESPADVTSEGEPVPRAHLSVWARWDWVLLAFGVAGLIYFLQFRDSVFPGSKTRLEVDATAARREVENLASRLGRPYPLIRDVRLECDFETLFARILTIWDSHEGFAGFELPLFWRITWEVITPGYPVRERYALVNSKGEVAKYSDPFSEPSKLMPGYQPASIDRRREIARAAVVGICGPVPPNFVPMEMSGGEWGAFYNTSWYPPPDPTPHIPASEAALLPWAEVSLVAEQVTNINCGWRTKGTALYMAPGRPIGNKILSLPIVFVFFIMTTIFFGMGQCYRLPIFRKRLPLAVILGFSGVWILRPAFSSAPTPPGPTEWGALGTAMAFVAAAVGVSAIALTAVVAIEHRLTRLAPGWIATFVFTLRGKLLEPAVGVAVIRGACGGLMITALETLAASVSMAPRFRGSPMFGLLDNFFNLWLEPTALGQATLAFSPAFFVLASAVFHGLTVGLTFAGFALLTTYKSFQKSQQTPSGRLKRILGWLRAVLVIAVILATSALSLRLHFAQAWGMGLSEAVLAFLLAGFLGWLLLAYDVLTVIVAVATYVLWTVNYPLLGIFEVIGNSPEWGIFIGWGVLVAAAAAVAFRAELARSIRRAKTEME